MMRLLYPLVASALVTILPFLITFEKGQDIVRGLFGYSEFGLLLLFVWLKNFFSKRQLRSVAGRASLCGMIVIVVTMVVVAWLDLLNLLALKGENVGWYGVLPFLTCAVAVAMVWKVPHFEISTICMIMFVALVLHLEALNHYAAQPLAQFPVVDYLARSTATVEIDRKNLPDDFRERYSVTDSVTITRNFLDTARSNVVILVESWGIPMRPENFESELSLFDGISQQVGVHARVLSRTRTAEREDLLFRFTRDSLGRRDSTFLPNVYAAMGFKTTFLYGGDSTEQWRYKYVKNIGFENAIWGASDDAIPDSLMMLKIDSMIVADKSDSLSETKRLIAFTTRDTKFPLPGFANPYSGSADSINEVYSQRLFTTLKNIANLARKHSDVRFIVQGDHEPILSPRSFQERFYKRWVPFVILN